MEYKLTEKGEATLNLYEQLEPTKRPLQYAALNAVKRGKFNNPIFKRKQVDLTLLGLIVKDDTE